jgi:hypothetical protein
MAEKRLIYAEDVIRHLEKWIIEAEKCEAASTYIVATTLKHVLKLVNLAPTAHPTCTCQKWHPASEIPPLHHEVDENKCEGTIECDVSEQLLLYTEEEGYKVGVYMKDCYGFTGWLNPDYGGTIHHVVEWQYPQKPSKERSEE